MRSTLSDNDQLELARLLKHVAENDDGFIPDPAYRPFHKLVPWPVVEVLIRDAAGRFVLTHRDDDFKGWHIPGTYIRPGETLPEACTRCVRQERVADGVSDFRLIAVHAWQKGEHPFGYPISNIVVSHAVGPIFENEHVRWFDDVPPDVIKEQHPRFLSFFKAWLAGEGSVAAIL